MATRVLVVGSDSTARRAADALNAAGHEARAHAVIETVLVATPAQTALALARLPASGWILFSSPAAVRHLGAALGKPMGGRLAAVQGPGTAQEARAAGLVVEVEATVHTAEGLVAAIMAKVPPPGPGFLLLTAEAGRGIVEPMLRDAGYQLESLLLYGTRKIRAPARATASGNRPDVVIFSSPSSVRAYLEEEKPPAGADIVAMGKATEQAIRNAGYAVRRVADDSSIEGLVKIMNELHA